MVDSLADVIQMVRYESLCPFCFYNFPLLKKKADLNNTEISFVFDGGVSVDQRKMNAVR